MNRAFKIGIFDDEEKFISSIKSLQKEYYIIYDVFTPYPVHDVFHLLKRKSRLPTAAYFLGLFAIIAVLAFLYYTSVLDWPIDYGGKPFNSFPSFIVVTIVLTIFTVTIGSLAAFSARSGLYPGKENTIFDHRSTDDKFVIVVNADTLDNSESGQLVTLMQKEGAVEVLDKEFETINA
jgi:hypothetical protein